MVLALGLAAAPAHADEASSGRPEGEVLDRVVAVVRLRNERDSSQRDEELVTESDLELEAKVALIQHGGVAAAFARLDAATLESALEQAIAERLLVLEADKLNAYRVEPEELDRAERDFIARFRSQEEFERFLRLQGADRRRVRAILERGLRAAKELDGKIHLRAQISESEVRQYFDAHRAEMGAASFEDKKLELRGWLFRQRYQKLAKEETAALRKAADVRNVASKEDGT